MEDISFEEIENLDDVEKIWEVASEYGVPLGGCNTCEEWKERISLHKEKLSGQHPHLLDRNRCENLKIEDQQKRDALCHIFETVQSSLEGSFPLLTKILKSRGISNDLSKDLHDHVDALKNGECYIVVAGQASAGKSTLLNLLLGMDVLPKATLSCTSSICKLGYDPKFKIRLTKDGKVKECVFKNQEEITAHLEDLVAVKEFKRLESGDTIPEVEIYLPCHMLMSGLTIVDTPGFGESEAMDTLVKRFVNRGHVAAFVYVVKTDSAGGVQEDRLVRFLSSFMNHTKGKSDQQMFNPRAALFVGNRWDQIEDEEKAEVKASIMEKLSDVWPRLEDNQVCFISTTRAKANLDVDKDYIINDLRHLLQSLSGLAALAHHDVIKKPYEWLKTVMKECTNYLKAILSQIAMADEEHKQKRSRVKKQLQALQTCADNTMEELMKEYETALNTMKRKFIETISSQGFTKQVSDWNISEIPSVPKTPDEWELAKVTIDAMIVNKIFKIIDSTDECTTYIADIRSSMLGKIKKRLRLLDEDMEDISADLIGESVQRSRGNRRFSSVDEDTITAQLKSRRDSRSFMQKLRSYTIKNESNMLNPRAFVCRAIAPVVEKVVKEKLKKMQKQFQDNPSRLMKQRTEKVLSAVREDEDLLGKVVARYTEKHLSKIDSISSNIPSFIQTKETLMDEIISFRKEARKDRDVLKKAMECLEPQKELLRGFGYLHVKDVDSDDIHLMMDDPRIRSSTQIKVETRLQASLTCLGSHTNVAQSLWAVVQKAGLSTEQENIPIMVKSYNCQLDDPHLFKEIAKLRCLEHRTIAKLLGMTRTEGQSGFVFDNHMTSARRYLRRHTTIVNLTLPSLLMGLVEGLEALHRDELVHMELSLDTVTVNDSGEVKLCNMCLPRKCNFPSDIEAIEAAEFTCLSPKVLKGSLYSHEDDVYSLGILMYEVLLREKPYGEQKSWTLSRFINEVHPGSMLRLRGQDMCQTQSDLLRGCLSPGRVMRLPLTRIRNMLQTVFDDR